MGLSKKGSFLIAWMLFLMFLQREIIFDFLFGSAAGFYVLVIFIIISAGILLDSAEKIFKKFYRYSTPAEAIPELPADNKYYDDDNYSYQYRYHKGQKRNKVPPLLPVHHGKMTDPKIRAASHSYIKNNYPDFLCSDN